MWSKARRENGVIRLNVTIQVQSSGFEIALGTEVLWLSARGLGAETYIPGLENAFPEICGNLYEEGIRNDIEKCRETQFKVNKIRDIMYIARSTQLSIYAMLEIRGVMKAYPRSPFVPATQKEIGDIKDALQDLGMI